MKVPTVIKRVPTTIPVEKITQPEQVTKTTEEKKYQKIIQSKESNYLTIKASMIGTFYRSSSPENPPFVNVGDTIKEGDTICIIEAMKLFNEIESEISGKIIKVLVDDSTQLSLTNPYSW